MKRKGNNLQKVNGVIYLITFPSNKYYVGQTFRGFEERKKQHKRSMNKEDYPVYRAMRKYGWDNLKWEIVDTAKSIEELYEKERYWISKYRSYVGFFNSQGYNANLGGGRNAVFGPLNDKELEEFGNDYRAGMSKDDLQKKYKIEHRWTLNSIYAGRQWNEFTGIPKRDFSIYPKNTKVTSDEVDDILDKFQEIGRCEIIAKELNIHTRVVTEIVKGKKWNEYTGIKDISFYNHFHRHSTLLTNQELETFGNFKLNGGDKDVLRKRFYFLKDTTFSALWHGRILNKYTKIPRTEKEYYIENPRRASIKAKDVDKILELNKKGRKGTEISKELNIPLGIIHRILEGSTWGSYTGIKYKSSNRRYLKDKEVLDIVERLNNKETPRVIADFYKIDINTIYKIRDGKNYSKITGIKKKEK